MQHLQPNTILQGGKYRIEKLLGQGGFGITYLAEQCLLKKKVAIKEFFIRDLCARDDTANVYTITQTDMVERYRQKFFKEAQILARLNHPGIVRVTDIFEENETAYYVMDYVEGESLDKIIKRNGPLPEHTALPYISKVADALEYIHQQNINHLDIKPANIMIHHNDDEPILIDFGVSKQYDEQKDQTTTTPPGVSNGYSPLEQYKPGGVGTFSPQADIYALGATLYKLLTGQTPPNASDMLNDGLPPLPDTISLQVRKAIKNAMRSRRDERPKSVRAWMQMVSSTDMEETIIDQPIASKVLKEFTKDTSFHQPITHSSNSKWWLWVLIGLLALLVIGGGLWMHKDEEQTNQIVIDEDNGNKHDLESYLDEKTYEQKKSTDIEEQSDNEIYSHLVDMIGQWDRGHKSGETYLLFSLYANRVLFYGKMRSRETVFEIIEELLYKDVGFSQISSNIDISILSETLVRCDFNKQTFHEDGRVNNYPSYLLFENVGDKWLIVEESDAITDRNLRKKKGL